ncbi:MAG: hypothetical protein QOE86_3360 [Solirubrobacteraceae bacterium]|jgi:hypothetical protein|nr:hypothetical protein [Solirubrobacteraceae bacterium]
MTVIFAVFGVKALFLLYIWLIAGIVCSYLSQRKGYGERPGLATGLLLSAIGIVVWLVWPAKDESDWKVRGVFGRERKSAAKA